jgi:putative DNA methylase
VAKASRKKTAKSKKELLDEAIAEVVGAGRKIQLESVDFSDPNRPKTCLEVDFPILPINHIASIEASSGAAKKPIYQMSKWWARRQPSVFRAMLIAAATKSPDDPSTSAKQVWNSFYCNHQQNEAFKKLKVADIFMGGGTTIVEGVRLGMEMHGTDLNPVAWLIVKNELARVEPAETQSLLDHIEAEVKPQVMQFYACDCPRGHKGSWKQKSTDLVMGTSFDPKTLKPHERMDYVYYGPEIIYTFWAKHGACQVTGCGHRTPIMSSPVFISKTLSVRAWHSISCYKCNGSFDVEEQNVRMAPSETFVVSPAEPAYTVREEDGSYACPHCGSRASSSLGKSKNKNVDLTLLVHPDWMKGSSGVGPDGTTYGGRSGDPVESTIEWYKLRAKSAGIIEVRGPLVEQITLPGTGEICETGKAGGNVPQKATLACAEPTCGRQEDVLTLIDKSGHMAPVSPFAECIFCPECSRTGEPNGGRTFVATRSPGQLISATLEWDRIKNDELREYWPRSTVPEGLETSVRTPLHKYHFHYWSDFFNERQLLVLARLLSSIQRVTSSHLQEYQDALLGAFQLYLRYNCMFTIWHMTNNQISAFLSNNNLQPKNAVVETAVFSPVGEGTWRSASSGLVEGLSWRENPWELVTKAELDSIAPSLGAGVTGKTVKVYPKDPVGHLAHLQCCSATNPAHYASGTLDLVVTDPPFGDIVQYAELAEFFYSWLRLPLLSKYPNLFSPEHIPVMLEAVENEHRHQGDSEKFYQRVLTACWKEAYRILKDGGLLTFTFHHDKDEPWVAVLESLFDAGFYLEATYPIRSDQTKGEGSKPGTFGAQKVEYDIIHVCRKRVDEPQEISWARLRRQILSDVRQLKEILEHHQQAGLQEADLQVIRRGKALEYYSKHYGKVYVEKGREFTVKEALTGINQLLDDQRDSTAEVPPVDAEPYTRQFLRLFADKSSLPRDQIQKYLRGTGVSPNEFQERGWCFEEKKVFHIAPPLEQAQRWKGVSPQGMARDFDQAMFLIGACYENSGIRVQDTLSSDKFNPHPATGDVIDWLTRHGGDSQMKEAARLAKQLFKKWEAANEPKVKAAQQTFDFAKGEV